MRTIPLANVSSGWWSTWWSPALPGEMTGEGIRHSISTSRIRRQGTPVHQGEEFWDLTLYIAGQTARSSVALSTLENICAQYLPGRYSIDVIDLAENPELSRIHEVMVAPTLVRRLPGSVRKILGDLADPEHLVVALEIQSRSESRYS